MNDGNIELIHRDIANSRKADAMSQFE